MPARKLKAFLDRNHLRYITIQHSPAYTAEDIAAAAYVPRDEFAKTVILMVDGSMAVVALPCCDHLDLDVTRDAIGATYVRLATEEEFGGCFPDCEIGAMPPFGNLYDLPTYVTEGMMDNERIAFNAGTHRELIEMDYDDFARLVQPRVIHQAVLET